MQKINRLDILVWLPRVIFFVAAAIFLGRYFIYLNAVVPFPYDWEPTDGDHLNFAHRLAQGLAIYLPLKDGQVLSIYNPLYHGIVALLGGTHSSLSFARAISLLFWLLIPLVVLWYFRKKWGFFYAAVAALFVLLPAEAGMLIDIVHVSPNSTMAFMFLATLLYANNCTEKQNAAWWNWLILGAIGALCYLAKQQGLIAIAVTTVFLLVQRVHWRSLALTLLGFLLVFMASASYLEFMNSGEYLRATLIDLRKIMITTPSLAQTRLRDFLLEAHFYFFVCVIYSFYISVFRDRKLKALSIWQISFLLHIPFLLAILGNGGGGPNYFLSMWISMVLLCIETVRRSELTHLSPVSRVEPVIILAVLAIWGAANHPNYVVMGCWVAVIVFVAMVHGNNKTKSIISTVVKGGSNPEESYGLVFANVLLVTLFVNAYVGMTVIAQDINRITLPTPTLEKKMQDYYQAIAVLVADKPSLKILTNRNIGALVSNNLRIENEGCTMFSYAWNSPTVFDHGVILNAIQNKKFDLITTGIQEYPEEVKREIAKYYRPALSKEVNLYFGNVGLVTVFVPNAS